MIKVWWRTIWTDNNTGRSVYHLSMVTHNLNNNNNTGLSVYHLSTVTHNLKQLQQHKSDSLPFKYGDAQFKTAITTQVYLSII